MQTIIGIDSGAKGGICVINHENGKISDLIVKPYDRYTLAELISYETNPYFVIEKVHAFRGQGVVSTFNFGKVYGEIFGVLAGRGMIDWKNIFLVEPQIWKKYYGLIFSKKTDKKEKKQASIDKAHTVIKETTGHDIDLRKSERCKKDHDGMAEAFLIANYGLKNL